MSSLNDVGLSEQVAHAQGRERERLRERAQDDEVGVAQHVRAHGVAAELEVRLVDHHYGVRCAEQIDEERLVGKPARGIVGVGDDDDVDVALGHARQHRFGVDREVRAPRDAHHLGAGGCRIDGIHRERRGHVEQLAPGSAPRQQQVEDELVSTVADEHVLRLEPVRTRDELAQLGCGGVRIPVEAELGQSRLQLRDDLAGQVGGVLVAREHDLGAHVLGVVRDQVVELRPRRAIAVHQAHAPSSSSNRESSSAWSRSDTARPCAHSPSFSAISRTVGPSIWSASKL